MEVGCLKHPLLAASSLMETAPTVLPKRKILARIKDQVLILDLKETVNLLFGSIVWLANPGIPAMSADAKGKETWHLSH